MTGKKSLVEDDFLRASKAIGCDVASIKAVASVESSGGGFLQDGRPIILFEGHYFYRLTKGIYSSGHPTISYPSWTRKFYSKRPANDWDRMAVAVGLDRQAALQSASWGMFQIMGSNFEKCGFESVQSFVNAMFESEGRQLDAFVSFLKTTRADKHLIGKNWAGFARSYNGPRFAENAYDKKLSAAYERFKGVA